MVALRDERGGTSEVTDPSCCDRQSRKVDRQLREHPGVAEELNLSRGDRARTLDVPYGVTCARSRPAPPQHVLHGDVGHCFTCSLQRRGSGRAPFGGQQSEAFKQQVKGARTTTWRRKGPDGARDRQQDGPSVEMRTDTRRAPSGQVGLARELQVERL